MAVLVLVNEKVVINSVDLSDHVRQATLTMNVDDIDTTAMNSGGWRAHTGGLKNSQLQVEFNQDFAAASVDATLWAAFGTTVTFQVNPVNAANSTTNPAYTGSVVVTGHQPLSNKVGELATTSATWPVTGAVSRATT
jgi:predicted secreted protein